MISDFIIRFPFQYNQYLQKALNYNECELQGSKRVEEKDEIGREIFDLIKPFIFNYDQRLVRLIPQRTLNQMKSEFEDNESFMKLFDLGSTSDIGNESSDQDNSMEKFPDGS